MFVSMKMIFYFCNVKSFERYIAAALRSVFCAQNLLVIRYSRIKVWGSSNAPKVFARMNLTAPCAAFLLTSKLYEL